MSSAHTICRSVPRLWRCGSLYWRVGLGELQAVLVPSLHAVQIYDLLADAGKRARVLRNAGIAKPCPRSAWSKAYRDFGCRCKTIRDNRSRLGLALPGEAG